MKYIEIEGICSACKNNSTAMVIDIGIGHYEYWGAKGFDSCEIVVSKCCESIIEKDGKEIELKDLEYKHSY